MTIRRRRRWGPDDAHSKPDERWMASYLDMITVLMCMFIVLFAMSTVDQQKFTALRDSLATGFGQEVTDRIDITDGVIAPPELIAEKDEIDDLERTAAQQEFDDLAALRERLRTALEKEGLGDKATFSIDTRGLSITLVSAETFFETNSTRLSTVAIRVIDTLGTVLATIPNEISVEGHADNRQSAYPYPTNWELSSARATQVLRRLVESRGIDPAAIQSVGFGDARPVAAGGGRDVLAQNRRVDVVVLSDAEEEVRRLLPGLQAKSTAG